MRFKQYVNYREGLFDKLLGKPSVSKELGKQTVQGALGGSQAVQGVAGGVASMMGGNIIGGGWEVIKNAIDAFSNFSDMGSSASMLAKAIKYKKELTAQLTQSGVRDAAKILEVMYSIDTSIKDLFSPALIKETLLDFVQNLGSSMSLGEKTFAAAMERAAQKVYGSAKNSAGQARQAIASQLQSIAPPAVQRQINAVLQHISPEESWGYWEPRESPPKGEKGQPGETWQPSRHSPRGGSWEGPL